MIGCQAYAQENQTDLIGLANIKFNQIDDAISKGEKQVVLHLQDEIISIAEKIEDLENRFLIYGIAINKFYSIECYQEAIALSSTSLQKARLVFGEKHKEVAFFLYLLSFSYAQNRQIQQAITYGEQSVQLYEDIGATGDESYLMAILLLANYYNEDYQYPKGIETLKRCLLNIDTNKFPATELAIIYRTLANNYTGLNNYLLAQYYTEKALELYEDKQSQNYLSLKQELARLYSKNNNHDKAIYTISEVCNSLRTRNDNEQYALALCDKASIYISSGEIGRINEAITFANEAISILETMDIKSDKYVHSLMTLAEAYRSMDLFDKSQEIYKRVYNLQKQFLDRTNTEELEILAISAVLANNIQDGQSFFLMLKEQILQEKGEKSLEYANIVYRLSELYYLSHDYQNAIINIMNVLPIMRGDLAKSFFLLDDKERTGYWSKYDYIFRESLPRMCYATSNSTLSWLMFDASLLSKGILLNTERVKRKLMQEETSVNDFVKPFFLNWRDVQAQLKDDDMAIEFIKVTPFKSFPVYVAVTIRPQYERPRMTTLFIEDELKQVSDTLYYQCKEITNLVWDPLLPELEGIKNIYFSPSGALYNIGIEYLPGMEDYNIYRLTSTRELVTEKEIMKGNRSVLYGGLDYYAELDTLSRSRRKVTIDETFVEHADVRSLKLRGGKEYLQHTKEEVEDIADEFHKANWTCLLDTLSMGTEDSFKLLSGKKVNTLHIATHGFYYTKEEVDDKGYQFMLLDNQRASAEDMALTRTGLLLSGANHILEGEELPDNVEDGILTAKEIADVDFRGLDLVVLSACQTGLGDISQGEGVFGLQRGFKKAGANSILMSLWEVDDKATQILMTQFYKNWLSGQGKRQALLSAQKFLRETEGGKYNEPKYWAAFILLDGIEKN